MVANVLWLKHTFVWVAYGLFYHKPLPGDAVPVVQ